jgi:SagB-type dehydrogenase family enzyme
MTESIGPQFMRVTQYPHLGQSDQVRGLPQPPLELPHDGSLPTIPLPAPDTLPFGDVALRSLLDSRRSLRAYAAQPISLPELSWLLWCTQGVQKVISRPATLRPVPSAGARHAFETYVLANRVEGVTPGLYRFIALEHKLVQVSLDLAMAGRITAAALGQEFVRESAATFIWVAVPYRMTWRYQERGYRYLHLDAGHVCQNLYLAAESIGCGACAVAAYDDKALNAVLGLDGETQFAIYLGTVGKKK